MGKLSYVLYSGRTERSAESVRKTIKKWRLYTLNQALEKALEYGYPSADEINHSINAHFKIWGDIFQDTKIANAILDRFLHHATVVNITGDSYRLKDYLVKENA